MNSNSISSGIIQTRFNLPSNPYKIPSPSHHFSFNHFKSPLISIRKARKPPPNVITGDTVYTQSPVETLYDTGDNVITGDTVYTQSPVETLYDTGDNVITGDTVYTQSPVETLYDLLGVPKTGTPKDIKRAYKQMALKCHPDQSPPDRVSEYTVRFIQVQEAYETLSDPEARAMYDCNLAKGLHLAFSVKKGSRFEAGPEEMARWRRSWEVQVEELKRRSTAATGGRMSWAARIRQQRGVSDLDQ